MKKVLFTVAAVMTFGLMNAQEVTTTSAYKPVKGTIATEVGLTGGLNNTDFDLNTGVVKFRYFFKDDMALRLGLGINSNKEETVINPDPTNPGTLINKNSNNLVNLGIEKHFAGSDRLSTYAGADLLIGFNGASGEYTENGYSYEIDGAQIDPATGDPVGNASTQFGFRLFTGADYYITKKVFLGVEAGLNFLASSQKDIVISETGSENENIPGGKSGGLSTNVVGGVRIGFQF
ncbi:outer membrane beta-barrel protein [Flavobacterium sp. F372]|uniref:Outer membrane beta-barrel protein n=1 Tax=Flavobacterium bernardetii TaxID=2813823 RepID=A0ABR7J297_9FLAO|nr:outer membrane beta-barrel protein [Flavobacterium bernardetii]MBC5836063.1 outer membrane beta-barrel protein [Flavobacterium bernardetii]NHF71197.1 outer membrane beta-barrel protein [Flavobacterium bernardetii]